MNTIFILFLLRDKKFLNYLSKYMTFEVVVLMAYALCAKTCEVLLEPVAVSVLSLEVNALRACNITPYVRA
jgi:branched-subunit amino acid transport protein AzlD